jgi:putative transposase
MAVTSVTRRFVRGRPTVAMPPETVAINPVKESGEDAMIDARVNFPTLPAAGYVKEMLSLK